MYDLIPEWDDTPHIRAIAADKIIVGDSGLKGNVDAIRNAATLWEVGYYN